MSPRPDDSWASVDFSDPQAVLTQALALYGKDLAIANSFSLEDVLLVDWAWNIWPSVRVFSLDTGRLPEESFEIADALARRGIEIEWLYPEATSLAILNREDGVFGFKGSLEARHRCCGVRKLQPLRAMLRTLDAWVTGQRRQQSVTRGGLEILEASADGAPLKINPLAHWSLERVKKETERRGLPQHRLYSAGYTSIGCAPCTRATAPGEDERAGRWWWEQPEHKECGIHDRLHTPNKGGEL